MEQNYIKGIFKQHFMRSIFPLVAVFGACAFAVPGARAAVPADFAKTFTVTVPHGLADETLTSFPLLLRLGTSIDGFDYADFRQDGADILITDASGNALPYELENWDTNGESRLWVRVPSVAEGTTLAVYYGTEESVALSEKLGLTGQLLCAKTLEFHHPITDQPLRVESRLEVNIWEESK